MQTRAAVLALIAAQIAASTLAEEKHSFESYTLVILVRGPTAKPPKDEEAKALMPQHLAHLKKMFEAGKMVVAGPLGDQPDPSMRGICLYRTSLQEAKELAGQDPMVKAGKMAVTAMTWYVEKGFMMFPKSPIK